MKRSEDRITRRAALAGAVQLGPAHVFRAVDDLALQIGEIDHVVVDKTNPTYSCSCQIEVHGRAQSASSNDQYGSGF